jgi:hypothetical protein
MILDTFHVRNFQKFQKSSIPILADLDILRPVKLYVAVRGFQWKLYQRDLRDCS